MSAPISLKQLLTVIDGAKTEHGYDISGEIIRGDVDVLQVTLQSREEFPIYITIDESQILCIVHLWKEQEIKPGQREELIEALLTMNVSMPLSAFSKVGDQYIIYGALATTAPVEEIVHEIEVLSHNTLDAIEAVSEYLA